MSEARSFVVHKDELAGRFDVNYYCPITWSALKALKRAVFPVKTIGEISKLVTKGESPLWKGENYAESGVPFLRGVNVKGGEITLENVVYVSEETHRKMKRSQLQPRDILLTMAGTLGDAAVVPETLGDTNINQDLARIVPREGVNPYYVYIFLNSTYGGLQVKRKSDGMTRKHINFQAIRSIKIPIPPREIQDKIVAIIREAYKRRVEKLKEAKEIHNSINDYVVEKLGIKISKVEEKRSFVVKYHTVEKRFDSRFYQPKYIQPIKILEEVNSLKTISEISKLVASGATPRAKGSAYTDREKGIPFIRITNLKNGKIDLTEAIYIKREIHEGALKRSQLQPNDVLLSMAGTIGVSVVVPDNLEEANINQALARIVLKEGINPHYVSQFLNSPIGRLQTERLCRPAVQANINLQEINSIKIPVPPLEVQNKIAAGAQRRRQRAEQLKLEAEQVVKEAKEKVEKMILGE